MLSGSGVGRKRARPTTADERAVPASSGTMCCHREAHGVQPRRDGHAFDDACAGFSRSTHTEAEAEAEAGEGPATPSSPPAPLPTFERRSTGEMCRAAAESRCCHTGKQSWRRRASPAAAFALAALASSFVVARVAAANWAQTTGPQAQNNVISYVPGNSRPHWSGREGMSIAVSNISDDSTLLAGKAARLYLMGGVSPRDDRRLSTPPPPSHPLPPTRQRPHTPVPTHPLTHTLYRTTTSWITGLKSTRTFTTK